MPRSAGGAPESTGGKRGAAVGQAPSSHPPGADQAVWQTFSPGDGEAVTGRACYV